MKRIIALQPLILFFASAFISVSYADTAMEVIAEWEKHAQSRIWGEYVLKGQSSFTGEKFRINALCDNKTIIKARAIKQKALKALESLSVYEDKSGLREIYATMLENIGQISVKPVTAEERNLIYSSFSGRKDNYCSGHGINEERPGKDILYMICPAAAFLPIQAYSFSAEKRYNDNDNIHKDNYRSNLNLRDYSTHSSKADYYELFLYIWEDSPGLELISTYNTFPSRILSLPKTSIIHSKILKPERANQEPGSNNKDNYLKASKNSWRRTFILFKRGLIVKSRTLMYLAGINKRARSCSPLFSTRGNPASRKALLLKE